MSRPCTKHAASLDATRHRRQRASLRNRERPEKTARPAPRRPLPRVFEPVVCPRLLGEVRRGLHKGFFRNHVAEEDIERIVLTLARASVQLRDPRDPPSLLRDPTDDYLVALARTARARAIVTGDKDLLEHPGLHPPALTVRAACELFGLDPS